MRKQANEIEEYTDFDSFLESSSKPKRKTVRIGLFDRITVSRRFRQVVAESFPALGHSLPYWRMMNYLLFGACDDHETNRRLLTHANLADIAGHKGSLSKFSSLGFLKQFQADVFSEHTFTWTDFIAKEKCRQVATLILPAAVQQALEEEFERKHYETGRVYFSTGLTYSRKQHKDSREWQKAKALKAAEGAQSAEAREILDYLNNLPPNLFTKKAEQNHAAAVAVAESLANSTARTQQVGYLKHIHEQPQPFYEPSSKRNTARIFGVSSSLTALKRVVRNAWINGWHKADLRSAQLAINARLWNVAEVQEFLAKQEMTIWESLYEHYDLYGEEAQRAKPVLKNNLYAMCYGMGVAKLEETVAKELRDAGIQRTGPLLTEHPLVKALLKGRDRMIRKIRYARGAKTCFGKWVSTEEIPAYRILAQISQAIELKIIHPLFVCAQKTDDFSITLFLHDGVAIHFKDKTKIPMWKRRLNALVTNAAKEFNAITELEWE